MGWRRFLWLLLVVTGVWAYQNSYGVPFLFDDGRTIFNNPRIRSLWPLTTVMGGTARPVVNVTLALNYAVGELHVRGYHVVNVAIHLLAGLLLYGIIRRTCLTNSLRPHYGHAAPWLALSIALIWLSHPLQTESVTYVVQRAESLSGVFLLLTIYGLVRGVQAPQPRGWLLIAAVSCAVGMATKPVMVVAPIVTLLYDRVFLAGSWRHALKQRGRFYGVLAMSWVVLAALLVTAPEDYGSSAGWHVQGVSVPDYLLTQPAVIVHYLRLILWPHPLTLGGEWPLATTPGAIIPPLLVVGVLIGATLWVWQAHPRLGFLGVWFFLLLAPTSSVIPLADLSVEHRLYLPLAGIVALGVVGMERCLRRIVAPLWRYAIAALLMIGLVAALGRATRQRNSMYADPRILWGDVVRRQPRNVNALGNLGYSLQLTGQLEPAIATYQQLLQLEPSNVLAYYNLGTAFSMQGRAEEAQAEFAAALRLAPQYAAAHASLGFLLAQQHRLAEAMPHLLAAMRLDPQNQAFRQQMVSVLVQAGLSDQAMRYLQQQLDAQAS